MSLMVNKISHYYGSGQVINNVSFTIDTGKIYCLLGPSGCGKTTLVRLISGLEKLQSGCISFKKNILANVSQHTPPEQRSVGLMLQDFALFPHLSVYKNIAFGLQHLPRAQRLKRVISMLELANMYPYKDRYPHTLSGGQQQRIALVRALAPGPSMMLLDEPFSNLDAASRAQVRSETKNILKSSNTTTLMVTHSREEAEIMSDCILTMNQHGCVSSL